MQGKQLRELESELWKAADQLRANSKLTATQYSMPVLGLIFLRHAYNRFEKVNTAIEEHLPYHPQRGRRPVTKNDFLERNALFLPEESRFEYLVDLPEGEDIGEAIDTAMKRIEEEYPKLQGVLPKNYSIFSADLLRRLIRIFNKEVLQKAEGDLFGKIYEYFLNKFAMTGAQEGGEFFTPMSLVQTIVNIIEPDHGTVFDPACGSAGMFVQTGYFIENEGLQPAEKVSFYGQEKAEMNTRLAKMNLAVHGLEGNIQEGNTFYEDKHKLKGACDFVMANPPFNVDGVDKGKDAVKKDPRLQLEGMVNLPKNDNANYLWIQYFYNYLNANGRAGFVMASSASDAGHSEKAIREKLVRTGAVDVMMAVGNNFFYTRSLPCTLWFYDRSKEQMPLAEEMQVKDKNGQHGSRAKDRVLMLDARSIYRKVTSKINDFSPEQLQNLVCVVKLYRGDADYFNQTLQHYLDTAAQHARQSGEAITNLQKQWETLFNKVKDFAQKLSQDNKEATTFVKALPDEEAAEVQKLQKALLQSLKELPETPRKPEELDSVAQQCKALRKPQDRMVKKLQDALKQAQKDLRLSKNKSWKELNVKPALDKLITTQQELGGNPAQEEPGLLYLAEYFWKQARWLHSRFPEARYRDVEGLCKLVSQDDIAAKDWSLSPGRYVGVAPAEEDDVDYEARLQELHRELQSLNEEAAELAQSIMENFKGLAV